MKRWIKLLALAYVAFEFFTPSIGFVRASAQGGTVGVLNFGTTPAPIPYIIGPVDPGNGQANLNSVIQEIDNVLGISFPQVTGAVNFPTLGESVTGQPVIIGAGGADTNIGISIQPKGSGNISLFSQFGTGTLQFANVSSFAPAIGIAATPGVPSGRAPIGMTDHLRGYFIMSDWLGRTYGTPVY